MGARSGGGGGAGGGGNRRVGARTNIDNVVGKRLVASGQGGNQVSLTVSKQNNQYSITSTTPRGSQTFGNMNKSHAQEFFSTFMKLNTWKKG